MKKALAGVLCAAIILILAAISMEKHENEIPGRLDLKDSLINGKLSPDRDSQIKPIPISSDVELEKKEASDIHSIAAYRPTPGLAGRNMLDGIYAKGVPKEHDSVAVVLDLLENGVSDDEAVALIRILGSLYPVKDLPSDNEKILLKLKKLTSDKNKEVAGMAAVTYARLGYFPDSESILSSAYESGAMGADGYFGELAHLMDVAPMDSKYRIARKINESSNAYAAGIIASSINSDPQSIVDHSGAAASEVLQLLQKKEPLFSSGLGEFGLGIAMQYSDWLRASASLDGKNSGRDVDALIVEKLSQPNTDPRKVMAYLLTPQADALIRNAPPGSSAAGLIAVASKYAAQFPGNPMLQEYAKNIGHRAHGNQ